MITLPELCLLILASYRGTQLLVFDDITEPLRAPIYRWHGRRVESRVRQAAVTLVSCVYCLGVWVSAGLLAGWLWFTQVGWPGPAEFVIQLLAVAGGQALLNRWDGSLDHDRAAA